MGKIKLFEKAERDSRISLRSDAISPADFMKLGDVYVYPSRLEGIGLSQVEALASGLPLIVPNEPPMSEFVHDPISRTTKIKSRRRRPDGYFWEMVETDVEDLAANLSWFIDAQSQKKKWKIIVRSYAEKYLDADQNFADFGNLMINLTPSRISPTFYFFRLATSKGLSIQYNYIYPMAHKFHKFFKTKLKIRMG